jgi:magnesium chelatase subunit D
MNPEEGGLRAQLLDRFALAVDIAAPLDPVTRQTVVENRIAFEQNPSSFHSGCAEMEQQLRAQVYDARTRRSAVICSKEILAHISESVCEAGVRSLRADLAIVRAAVAYAALLGDASVSPHHVATVLPLALAHRRRDKAKPPAPPSTQKPVADPKAEPAHAEGRDAAARIFAPRAVETFALRPSFDDAARRGASTASFLSQPGPVVRSQRTETPVELDVRTTLNHAVAETGNARPRLSDLHERVRIPKSGTRYLFVIDSSGSHAAHERMRLVKGAINNLLTRSFKNGDQVAIIVFRGTAAQVLLEPSGVLQEAAIALEYLPTGGRTPLAHALDLARTYVTPATALILLTDGRANVPLHSEDPWQDALDIAGQIKSAALVIDTENSAERLGRCHTLAEALGAEYVQLEGAEMTDNVIIALQRLPVHQQFSRQENLCSNLNPQSNSGTRRRAERQKPLRTKDRGTRRTGDVCRNRRTSRRCGDACEDRTPSRGPSAELDNNRRAAPTR